MESPALDFDEMNQLILEVLRCAWHYRKQIDLSPLFKMPPESLSPYEELPLALLSDVETLEDLRKNVDTTASLAFLKAQPMYAPDEFPWLIEKALNEVAKEQIISLIRETEAVEDIYSVLDKFMLAEAASTTDLETFKKEHLEEYTKPETALSRPFGYPKLDALTGGIPIGQISIVAARTGTGKTNFVLNVAAQTKGPVVIFSMEMMQNELFERIVAMKTGLSCKLLREHRVEDLTPILNVDLSNIFVVDDSILTYGDIRAKMTSLSRLIEPKLVIVDYLQLITYRGRQDSIAHRMQEIAYGLKAIAKDFKVPMLVVSQLNRDFSKRQDKRPRLSDLRDSGAIEQAAYLVLFLHRDDVYDLETLRDFDTEKALTEVIVAKNRGGATGMVEFDLNLDTLRMTEKEEEIEFDLEY